MWSVPVFLYDRKFYLLPYKKRICVFVAPRQSCCLVSAALDEGGGGEREAGLVVAALDEGGGVRKRGLAGVRHAATSPPLALRFGRGLRPIKIEKEIRVLVQAQTRIFFYFCMAHCRRVK